MAAREGIKDYYHGTSAGQVPSIMEPGLLPSMGAGTDASTEHVGLAVPGVYVAPSVRAAMQYPITPTTLT
eukprot:11214927-Lingulodinium_polyedra.AAC.1